MGDPRPGQIPDNIFLSVQQVFLAADQVGNKGDLLVRDALGTNVWILANAAAITADKQRLGGVMESRVDFDTTGLAAGAVAIEVLSAPSYIFAIAGGAINPGDRVKLDPAGQKFLTALPADITNGDVMGRYSRLAVDQAGNNPAVDLSVIIVKLGVGV